VPSLQAFGPFGKHEGKAVARLAALYGCRATLQGSKSHRKLVMVRGVWLQLEEWLQRGVWLRYGVRWEWLGTSPLSLHASL